ncbi:hypothetical protein Q4Q49_11450 [Shewanella sp. SP1S1-7]|uniref:hypothetical protein n=1 Tax=Shewanella sp. SP1S1-7 TaxID=3063536 RepID=UPI00288F2F0C|nr:hypothetical protein [Shewanella sp. SP1S1-7]MDT3335918.1 hypothetical protein [Shewanella sp. SP1S1-7]
MKSAMYFNYLVQLDNYAPSNEHIDIQHDTALNMLNSLKKEISRINELQPELNHYHVGDEIPTEWSNLLKIFTKFQKAVTDRITLQSRVGELIKHRQEDSSEYGQCLAHLHHLQPHLENLIASVFLCIGQHNTAMTQKFMFETGVNKIQSEQLKTMASYYNKYNHAMSILIEILKDFYSSKHNHPYPLNTILQWVDEHCIKLGIAFPKDRKAALFMDVVNNTLPPEAGRMKGAPKQEFRKLPEAQMAKYHSLFT